VQGQIGIGSSGGAPAGPHMRWPGLDGGNNWLQPYAARPRQLDYDASSTAAAASSGFPLGPQLGAAAVDHGFQAQQLNLSVATRQQQ
jgi:hypothetical protein